MGNAGSAHAQLQAVAAVSGATLLPMDAPEWQILLGVSQPLSRFDPGEVEREIRPHCAELGVLPPPACLAAAERWLWVPVGPLTDSDASGADPAPSPGIWCRFAQHICWPSGCVAALPCALLALSLDQPAHPVPLCPAWIPQCTTMRTRSTCSASFIWWCSS